MTEYFNYSLTTDAVLYFSGKSGVDGLFTPSAYDPRDHGKTGKPGEPRYQLRLLLEEGSRDLEALRELVTRAYGGRLPPKHPFTSGSNMVQYAVTAGKKEEVLAKMRKTLAGKTQFSAHATVSRPPMLGCFVNGIPTNLADSAAIAANKEKFFVGALVRAAVSLSGYTEFGGGVTAYVNSVFSTGRGERIGGTSDATAFVNLTPVKDDAPAETF